VSFEPLIFDRESGEWIARIILPRLATPWAEQRFATREEAVAWIDQWAARDAERHRRQEEESRTRRERQREEFVARVSARRNKVRQHFLRSRADVVVLDRIAYHRSEFRSIARTQAPRRPAVRTRTPRRRSVRSSPQQARAPDDDPPDPPLARQLWGTARCWLDATGFWPWGGWAELAAEAEGEREAYLRASGTDGGVG
jgi:hypothetical protein